MVGVLRDGLDTYNGVGSSPGLLSKWFLSGIQAGAWTSLVPGRFGGQALRIVANGSSFRGQIRRSFDTPVSTFGLHMAIRWNSLVGHIATGFDFTLLDSLGGYQLGVKANVSGGLELYRATSNITGTLLGATVPGIITLGAWHSFRLESLISDTVGAPVMKLDDNTVLSLTGQDTKNTANANVATLELGHDSIANRFETNDFDDIWCIDALGVPLRRVETLYASGDGGTLNLVPSTGATHFGVVDEATVSVADYLSGSVVGDIDLLTMTNLSSTPVAIDELNIISTAQKTDATGRSINNGIKSGATTSNGPDLSLAVGFTRLDRTVALDPNTGAAWTPAAVDALELQPRVAV